MLLKLEKARTDNWTKRKFFEGASAKLGPSLDSFGHPVTGLTTTEEKDFEKKLGLPAGTLSKASNYWNEFVVVVDTDGVKFDDSNPEDSLKVKFLQAQSYVAKGSKELLTNPKAEYILFSEEEEQKTRNESRRTKNRVLSIVGKMDLEERRGMVYMFGHNPAGMSDEAIEDFIYEKAELDPKTFELIAEDPTKEAKVFIHKLVKAGVLETKGGAYLYNGENIGYGLDAVALSLQDKSKQELRIALEKQLLSNK